MNGTFIDLFAGCGGLSLGLGRAGLECLFGVETNPDAFATYEYNLLKKQPKRHTWPTWLERRAWRAEDLLNSHTQRLLHLRGSVDLIAGGPPCQGFSSNGLRRPDDPRSMLIETYLTFINLIKPRIVLLENVVGFCSMKHQTGFTYDEYAVAKLQELGYDSWFQIIRSFDWGVPQSRPRFLLIAAQSGALAGIDPIQRLRVARRGFLQRRNLNLSGTSARDAICDLEEAGDLPLDYEWGHLAAFMHRSQIMGAFCRIGGFFEKPAQGDPPRRFSAAEMV